MAGVKISNLPALSATALSDEYATVQGGVTYKVTLAQMVETATTQQNVRLASTGALTVTYDNGVAGVGATLTNAGALAALTIDSVAAVSGDRILIKDQGSTLQNGIYTVTNIGSGAVAWILTRATDYDEAADIDAGDLFSVGLGTTNARTQWLQTAVVATMGTDPITFASNVVAGTGLTKTNNSIALTVPVAMANGGTNKVMVASLGAVAFSDADSLELSAVGTTGQLFQSAGAGTPVWTTATFPATAGSAGTILRSNGTNWVNSTSTFADTYAINTILFAGSADTISGLAAAQNGVLVSGNTNIPAMLAGPGTTGNILMSNAAAAPSFSTATFASTYAINSMIYASAADTMTALAPALSSVMISSAASTGVPAWSGALSDGQLIIGSTGATPAVANLTPGTGISIANTAGAITISATGGGFGVATIAGTSQAAAVNTMYIALNAGQTTLTLPAVYSVGDSVILVGSTANTGGWIVTAAAGDTVIYNGSTTSAGGTITSSALAGQTVEMVADVANASWVVVDTVSTTLTTA